jgi:hypothetical protein
MYGLDKDESENNDATITSGVDDNVGKVMDEGLLRRLQSAEKTLERKNIVLIPFEKALAKAKKGASFSHLCYVHDYSTPWGQMNCVLQVFHVTDHGTLKLVSRTYRVDRNGVLLRNSDGTRYFEEHGEKTAELNGVSSRMGGVSVMSDLFFIV